MALNEAEKQLLQIAADNAKEARDASIQTATLVNEHSKQITELFTQGRNHADDITVLKAEHAICKRNTDPGNKAERKANRLAVVALIVSGIIGGLGFLLSLAIAVKIL